MSNDPDREPVRFYVDEVAGRYLVCDRKNDDAKVRGSSESEAEALDHARQLNKVLPA